MKFEISDIRTLKLPEKQDAVICIGRIFTYMYSNEDALRALNSFKNNLKINDVLIFDNYETSQIAETNYFNGTVKTKHVERLSKIEKIQNEPTIYKWNCTYGVNGKKYTDENHLLRSFTQKELTALLEESGFTEIKHEKNFEPISFLTIAQKQAKNLDLNKGLKNN